jgi:L-iditol 2-dehydrogenase
MIGLTKLAAGTGHVELTERPERPPRAGEVLIRVHAAGICGTDLHIEAGEYPSAVPITLGHELAGVVVELGSGVDLEWLDARVVAETFFSVCRVCAACREGHPNLCGERRSIGTHVDGAFAPFVIVPAVNLHRIPDWLSDQGAALAEPLACVCHCLLDPPVVTPGDRVLAVGPGPIGLIAGQLARALGGSVLISGLTSDEARLNLARDLGLEIAIAGEEPGSFDVVIECSGSSSGAAVALEAVSRAGRYVQLGIFGKPVTVPLDLLLFKEIAFRTGFASTPRSWRRAMSLVGSRAIDLEKLVSDVVPLDAWEEAFNALRSGRQTKVLFDPRIGMTGCEADSRTPYHEDVPSRSASVTEAR